MVYIHYDSGRVYIASILKFHADNFLWSIYMLGDAGLNLCYIYIYSDHADDFFKE